MNFKKKLIAVATLLTVAAASMTSAFGGFTSSAAVDDNNDDWLHAVGSRLYDKDGNQVWLTGANWFGMNCTENFPHGLWSADADELLSSVADHGINIIRFPISTELLLSWMNGEPYKPVGLTASKDPYYMFNPDFCDENGDTMDSMGIFDVLMKKCKKYGIKALIDIHSPASHNSGHNYNLWYYEPSAADADNMAANSKTGEEITYDMWIESVTWLAEKYKNDDTIIAYDLKNEPHGKRGYNGTTCPTDIAKWDDSEDLNNWAFAATECGNSILDVNPNALILIEGVEQYPKTEKGYTYDTADIWQASADVSPWYGAWWGGNLRGVKDYPIDFGSKSRNSQIVYSPHDYGPSVYNQTWFDKDFTTQTLLDDYWYDTWAYINDQDIAPLLIGEWGGHMDGGKNQKWMELLRDYMIDNHINHTFWCLNPNSGDTGGLLDSSFTVWDDEKYDLFEPSLWQTSKTGKYIGLDHQQPLGVNGTGISVAEYYKSYNDTEGSNLDSDGSVNPLPTEHTTGSQSSDLKGDVNLNGTIEIADVVLLNKHLIKASVLKDQALENADVNDDKKLNVFDSIAIKRILL
ncbi:Endoglucanase E1 precursor [uncultured Ruminococcus sp.]|uniref:cellulase family glycosylhydrolase n=1 Tax=Porcipelethomonas ammoniilytica TaxID=2981722 RepID=UPI0008214D56|nr:Endoglucanase E1 precursor [uncultured Ruminococcus sp.]